MKARIADCDHQSGTRRRVSFEISVQIVKEMLEDHVDLYDIERHHNAQFCLVNRTLRVTKRDIRCPSKLVKYSQRRPAEWKMICLK